MLRTIEYASEAGLLVNRPVSGPEAQFLASISMESLISDVRIRGLLEKCGLRTALDAAQGALAAMDFQGNAQRPINRYD